MLKVEEAKKIIERLATLTGQLLGAIVMMIILFQGLLLFFLVILGIGVYMALVYEVYGNWCKKYNVVNEWDKEE